MYIRFSIFWLVLVLLNYIIGGGHFLSVKYVIGCYCTCKKLSADQYHVIITERICLKIVRYLFLVMCYYQMCVWIDMIFALCVLLFLTNYMFLFQQRSFSSPSKGRFLAPMYTRTQANSAFWCFCVGQDNRYGCVPANCISQKVSLVQMHSFHTPPLYITKLVSVKILSFLSHFDGHVISELGSMWTVTSDKEIFGCCLYIWVHATRTPKG